MTVGAVSGDPLNITPEEHLRYHRMFQEHGNDATGQCPRCGRSHCDRFGLAQRVLIAAGLLDVPPTIG